MLKAIIYWFVAGAVVGGITVVFDFFFTRMLIGGSGVWPTSISEFVPSSVIVIMLFYAIILVLIGILYHAFFNRKK